MKKNTNFKLFFLFLSILINLLSNNNELINSKIEKNLENLFINYLEKNNLISENNFFKEISDKKYENLGINIILNRHKEIFKKNEFKINDYKDILEEYIKKFFYNSYLKFFYTKNEIKNKNENHLQKIEAEIEDYFQIPKTFNDFFSKEPKEEIIFLKKNFEEKLKKNGIFFDNFYRSFFESKFELKIIELIIYENFSNAESRINLLKLISKKAKEKNKIEKNIKLIKKNKDKRSKKTIIKNVPLLICNYDKNKNLIIASDEHDSPLAPFSSLSKIYSKDKNGNFIKNLIITGDYSHKGYNDFAFLLCAFYRSIDLDFLIRGNHESYNVSKAYKDFISGTFDKNDINLQEKINKYLSEIFPSFGIFKISDKKILFSHGYWCDSIDKKSLIFLNRNLKKLKEGESKIILVDIIENKSTKEYYNGKKFENNDLIASNLCDISSEEYFEKNVNLARYNSDPKNHFNCAHKNEEINANQCFSGHNNNNIYQKHLNEDGIIPYPEVENLLKKTFYKNDEERKEAEKCCRFLPVHDSGNGYSSYELRDIYKTILFIDEKNEEIKTYIADLFGRKISK